MTTENKTEENKTASTEKINITINMQDVEFSTGKKYNIKESFTERI